jgi:GH24 family phage-related lysozyme (muramidase)
VSSLEGVKVGDTLIMTGLNMRGRSEEVTVTKVGRKYVHASHYGRVQAYRIDTGVVADGYGHTSLCTPAQHAERKHRTTLLEKIRALGLAPVDWSSRHSTPTLERVLKALEDET